MKRVIVVVLMLTFYSASQVICADEKAPETAAQLRSFEEAHDKLDIRTTAAMYTDSSNSFITVPADYPDVRDFDVAETPPTVDFGIIRGYEPWYLPVLKNDNYRIGGVWEGYGDVTMGPDGCYYFSIGDHRSYNGNAYIIRYDPTLKKHDIQVDLRNVIGWAPDDFADGKIHGDLDIGPGGDMWFLTYFGPGPTRHEWDTVYCGSWFLRYNIFSGETENLGIPLEGSSWPYYNYDWQRGIFFAAAEHDGVVFVYDTRERRMLYGGAPKNKITWHRRCTMLDHDTGMFYSTDTVTHHSGERYRGDHYFVSYRQRNNTFTRMKSKVPPNPVSGKPAPIRSHTGTRDESGAFWCFSQNGVFFRFFPDEDKTEYVGVNWGKEGYYTANMCFSPKKRYIYYVPGTQARALGVGTPLVQYDTKNNRKKVMLIAGKQSGCAAMKTV